jgi:hypothetical protein
MMATKVINTTVVSCDRDGQDLEPHEVNARKLDWNGKRYTFDLGKNAAEDLDASLADHADAVKRIEDFVKLVKPTVKGRKPAIARVATPHPAAARNPDSSAIRTWAKVNGWPKLGTRGRIPDEAIESYNKAH